MNLEELLKALGLLQDGQKFVEAVKALVAAKDGEIVQKGNQYKLLAKTLKETEDKLKGANERLTKFHDHIGIEEDVEDLEIALEEFINNHSVGGKGDGKSSPELSQLQKDIAKLQRELKKAADAQTLAEKKANEELAKRQKSDKNRALLAALTDNKAIKPEQLIKILSDQVKVNDDDSVVFLKDDGEEVQVGEGVKAWLDANPEFVLNSQKPGGGSGSIGGTKGVEAGSFGKDLAGQSSNQQSSVLQKGQEFYFGKGV